MMSGGRGTTCLADSLPASAVFGVVQLDAHGQELLADCVALTEIPTLASRLPLGDQPLDLRVDRARELDDVQDAIRVAQEFQRGRAVIGRRLTRVDFGVELLDEIEEMADCCWQVEVVAEGFIPALLKDRAPTLSSPRGGCLRLTLHRSS